MCINRPSEKTSGIFFKYINQNVCASVSLVTMLRQFDLNKFHSTAFAGQNVKSTFYNRPTKVGNKDGRLPYYSLSVGSQTLSSYVHWESSSQLYRPHNSQAWSPTVPKKGATFWKGIAILFNTTVLHHFPKNKNNDKTLEKYCKYDYVLHVSTQRCSSIEI